MAIEFPWIGYNPDDRRQLKALHKKGYHANLLSDGASGIVFLRTRDFPIILVQEGVPLGQGLSVPQGENSTRYLLTQIRELSNHQRTPIIVPYLLGANPCELMVDDYVRPVRLSQSNLADEVMKVLVDD